MADADAVFGHERGEALAIDEDDALTELANSMAWLVNEEVVMLGVATPSPALPHRCGLLNVMRGGVRS